MTLSSGHRRIPPEQWEHMRFGQICTNDPPGHHGETFADIKATIEKLCSISKKCNYPEEKDLVNFFNRVDAVNAQAAMLADGMK